MHKRSLIVFTVGCALLAPVAAGAQVRVDLRTGYAVPSGNADGGTSMGHVVQGAVPLAIGVGFPLPALPLTLGIHGEYAYALAGDGYDTYDSSHGTRLRLGVDAEVGLPLPRLRPWAALSAGWEWLDMSGALLAADATTGGTRRVDIDLSVSGPAAALSAGVDLPVAPALAVGPFLSFGLGRYTRTEAKYDGTAIHLTGQEEANHRWFELGLRGTFGL